MPHMARKSPTRCRQTRASRRCSTGTARDRPAHAERLALTRDLLAARRKWIVPLLPAMMDARRRSRRDPALLVAKLGAAGEGKSLLLLANLSDAAKANPTTAWGAPIWGGDPPHELPPWSVYAAIESQ